MKSYSKLLILFLLIGTVISCRQDSIELLNTTPTEFTKKAFLEMYNGAWCGYSPDGDLFAEAIREEIGADRFDFYEIHVGNNSSAPDAMTYQELLHMNQRFANGYPSGVINWQSPRAVYRDKWRSIVDKELSSKAACGLAIDTRDMEAGQATVKVELAIGPKNLPEGNYYIACYLYEKEMSGEGRGWDQVNYYSKEHGSSYPNHTYYNAPDPIVGYKHPNVARAKLHATDFGDPVAYEDLTAGSTHSFEYKVDISNYGEDLRVVAYLYQFTDHPGIPGAEMGMCNVQFVDVGTYQPFD